MDLQPNAKTIKLLREKKKKEREKIFTTLGRQQFLTWDIKNTKQTKNNKMDFRKIQLKN